MAITLISNIKQANNGKFWLVDSNDIRGGLYHVDQKAEMQVLPVDNLKEGMLCYVAAEQRFYQYKKDAEGNLAFDVWKVGFDKSETFTELDNKTIINSIIANSGLIDKLQDQIDAITGTGEGGDATTIAGLNAQLASLKNTLGKATEGGTPGSGLIKRVEDESLIYDPSNLVTLCRSCHEEMEKLSVKEQRDLLGEYKKEIDYSIL